MNQQQPPNTPPEISPEQFKQLERKFIPRIVFKTGLMGFTLATIMFSAIYVFNNLSKDDYQYLETVSVGV